MEFREDSAFVEQKVPRLDSWLTDRRIASSGIVLCVVGSAVAAVERHSVLAVMYGTAAAVWAYALVCLTGEWE